jgi:hypothetical protein
MSEPRKTPEIDPSELRRALNEDPEGKLLKRMLARQLAETEWTDPAEGTKRSDELKERLATFLKASVFRRGQLVKWKPKLKNRKRPAYGEPAIVVDVLDTPVFDGKEEAGSAYFREPLDIILGVIDVDGDFATFHFDSRRFDSAE